MEDERSADGADEPQAEQDPRSQREEPFPGARWLTGAGPKALLPRLLDGDPLGVTDIVMQGLRDEALLLDSGRVFLRAIARVAYAGPRYRGSPPLAPWLRSHVDRALHELVEEDREDDRRGARVDEDDRRCAILAEQLDVDLRRARRAAVAFNDLPGDVRRVYWAISVEGKTLNRHVAEGHGPPERARAQLKRAMLTLSLLQDPGALDQEEG